MNPSRRQAMHVLAGGMAVRRGVVETGSRFARPRPLSTLRPSTRSNKNKLWENSQSLSMVSNENGRSIIMPSSIRTFSSSTSTSSSSRSSDTDMEYEAVVVGAGPAGITAIGNLLENRIENILWIDDAFSGGRVNRYYREVPSNTKVKLFIDFATATAPFRKIVSGLPSRDRWAEPSASDGAPIETTSTEDKLQNLRILDQEKGCDLAHAADMCLMLTQGLKRTPGITTHEGLVDSAELNPSSGLWTVTIASSSFRSKRLILATGAAPIDPPLPSEPSTLQHLHLDTALSPTLLQKQLSQGPTTIAVIGASHSAVLVLRNLTNLALSSASQHLRIKWFTRHPLRYAEYEKDFIARDNTGLKGEAATWAKENLEPETLPSSSISSVLTKISYPAGSELATYQAHLYPDCTHVVQAIGYRPNPLPKMSSVTPTFDPDRGVFKDAQTGEVIPGLYGAGIAFPERVVDRKYGHEEMNVGFFKFMKAVKKWVGGWKAVAV